MLENRFIAASWDTQTPVGTRWLLLRFDKSSPPSWESYLADEVRREEEKVIWAARCDLEARLNAIARAQRKEWNPDLDREEARLAIAFEEYWASDPPELVQLRRRLSGADSLEATRVRFQKFEDHLQRWNGLCRVGETVDVVRLRPDVIALSLRWSGEVLDHSDLIVSLKEEVTFLRRHVRYCCDVLSYATVHPIPGLPKGLARSLGETTEPFRCSNLREENQPVILRRPRTILVADAAFRIVG